MRIKINNKYIEGVIVLFCIALYTLLKVYRNSINYSDSTQGGVWNIILVVLVLYCFVFFVTPFETNMDGVIRWSSLYALLVWFNGIITFNFTGIRDLYYYLVAPCFVPILIFFYRINLKDDQSDTKVWDLMWIFILCLLLYTFIRFFGKYAYYESSEVIALNNSYYAACVIPFFLRKKNKFGIIMVLISCLIVFISNKRAGIIGIGISFIFYYLINARISDTLKKALSRVFFGGVLFIILFLGFCYIDDYFNLNIINRLTQVYSDGGSGRSIIYSYVLGEIFNSSPFSFIFGHGVSSINHMSISLSSAHNDFLNVFYEYGLFSVISMIMLYVFLFVTIKRMIKSGYNNSGVFAYSVMIALFFSMFSANLDNQSFSLILAAYWGIELGTWKRQIQQISE